MTGTLAWHFLREDKLRDGRTAPADGEWLKHDGPIALCATGLHASEDILDALQHAPGNTLCRVTCDGDIRAGNDKLVCSRRRVEWRIDAAPAMRAFARWCALQVIHLWEAPQVVIDYLTTGDDSLRDAAYAAARDAARDAAKDAAWDAARDAARDAAKDAAWDAARSAAWAAAWAAARNAARGAGRDAAWAAAWAVARDAAREAQRTQLLEMMDEAREGRAEWVFTVPRAKADGREVQR